MRITIGIDISKDTLDAYQLPDNQHIQVENDKTGHKTLSRWIGAYNQPLVVFEATGAYHRNLEAALTASDTAFAKVNHAGLPKQRDAWQKPIALTLPGWRKWVLSWN
jgi:transposase